MKIELREDEVDSLLTCIAMTKSHWEAFGHVRGKCDVNDFDSLRRKIISLNTEQPSCSYCGDTGICSNCGHLLKDRGSEQPSQECPNCNKYKEDAAHKEMEIFCLERKLKQLSTPISHDKGLEEIASIVFKIIHTDNGQAISTRVCLMVAKAILTHLERGR